MSPNRTEDQALRTPETGTARSGSYFAFGLNHDSAPVSVRERFELNPDSIRNLYERADVPAGTEWIVISTCNRTEVYLYGRAEAVIEIQTAVEAVCGPWPNEHAFIAEREEALRHIFQVVSGLRSQVLGDNQILGQMKEAYRLAHASETVGPRLHRLMHTAFATAKRVISSTALGSGGASIARTAIGTLRHEFAILGRGMDELSILVLGCGAMGTRVLKELAPLRTTATWVANRSPERALRAAERHGATAVRWEDRLEFARRADVVFSTTGSDGFVIEKKDLEGVAPHATTLLIDISVPRNVDPAIAELEGYAVVNIDELRSGENGRVGVRRNIGRAEKICDDAVRDALGWENQTRAVEPAVRTLTETFETIRSRELERNIHRFPSEQQEDVDRLTRSIMQKLIAIPIVRLKAMAESDEDLVSRIEVLNSLFDKGECEE